MKRRNFLTLMGLSWLTSISPAVLGATITRKSKLYAESDLADNTLDPLVFYVSPTGNDTWSGKLANSNDAKTDGPFATISKARDTIRQLKRSQENVLKKSITVFLRGGTYFLQEPLIFSSEDSGTENFPITYAAYENEKPIISGARRITGWQKTTVNGKELWVADIPEVREGKWFFRQLWVNGERCSRARYPKQGYLKVAEVPDTTPKTAWWEKQTRFRFRDGDLKAWATATDAEVVIMTRWQETRAPILRIDESEKIIYFAYPSAMRIDAGDLYYVEHALELIDTPGEWYLQKTTGKLYYLPRKNENMVESEVYASAMPILLQMTTKHESNQFVENIVFSGLNFVYSEWYEPTFIQAAAKVPGAIYLEGARKITFNACTVAHVNQYGIELGRKCQYNRIIGCEIYDLGAGAIKIGEAEIRENKYDQTYNNEISDCHLYNGGRTYHNAVGIWLGETYKNRVHSNHIHDFYYSGISIGWTWGYKTNLARENIVEFNHIHHIGLLSNGEGPILNDKGGIYILGVQPGTVIKSNIIHDIEAFNYGGWGIYLDEGASNILVENNLVYRTRDGGFHLHYGRDNVIRNNIFAFGKIAQIRRSAAEQHLSFKFERNIIYWGEGKLLEGIWNDNNFYIDHNLYWHVGKASIIFVDKSWEQWRAQGRDQNSLIADPLFFDPERGDFRIKSNSPAFKLGFKAIWH
ncbi:MAG: right-handed parallel beta-helix repeat-containing protein [Oscillatoriaceae bacterium SKW80]|nr:right-handed parallel beta-helix repeat-containing protein [Oscillatoriaceae bacterium SKW80]HIK27231.1 right-handed parallel beta-helix repeat-containing protein [Oscillatoriaceae cyanobacterium M7585_C2015_266]